MSENEQPKDLNLDISFLRNQGRGEVTLVFLSEALSHFEISPLQA